jgi:hypothetical protein
LESFPKIPDGIFKGKRFICAAGSSNGIQFSEIEETFENEGEKSKKRVHEKEGPALR